MGPFNNRELASGFWVIVFAVWVLRKSDVRRSLGGVLQAFWRFKIVVCVCLLLLYVTGVVTLLREIGVWNVSLLKDTIVWFFLGAMAMMMRFGTGDKTGNIGRQILKDSIKVVLLLEFLVNTYTFPLVVELILVPVVALVAMLDVFASKGDEYASVAKVTGIAQMVVGFAILGFAVSRAVGDFQNLKSMDTFRDVALAPLMSVLMCPFIYIMLVLSSYELVFMRIDLGPEKSRSLRRYARRRIVWYAGVSLKRLQHLLRNHTVDLMHMEKEGDVDGFLEQGDSARR